MKVLVVDDTIAYRSMLRLALSEVPGVEVVGTASNGKLALQRLKHTPVDVIVMDIEMPDMDGLETVKALREQGVKSRVVMFSALTAGSAEMTMKALQSGADDLVAKPGAEIDSQEAAIAMIRSELVPKLSQFQPNFPVAGNAALKVEPTVQQAPRKRVLLSKIEPELIVIASSTGGPAALETLFTGLGSPKCPPILIAQHMPPVFTKMLAERIKRVSDFEAKEAEDGEAIQRGHVYVAPGDYHLEVIRGQQGQILTKLHQGPKVNSVRPAADLLFQSAAEVSVRPCVSIVLTGMGDDGCRGVQRIKNENGFVFIQDEESSVVWGMPGAVYQTGNYDEIGTLKDCFGVINRFCN